MGDGGVHWQHSHLDPFALKQSVYNVYTMCILYNLYTLVYIQATMCVKVIFFLAGLLFADTLLDSVGIIHLSDFGALAASNIL